MSTPESETYDVNELGVEEFFNYHPSLALAIVALCLFVLGAAVLGYLTEKYKRRFVHTLTATGLLEAAGYAALIYCTVQSGKSSIFVAYVVMQTFVIMAPNIIQAGMYWQVGLVLAFSPGVTRGRRWLRGSVVTAFFILADVTALVVQAAGISIWASSQSSGEPDQSTIRLGCGITLAGLAVQLAFFACFAGLTIWSHRHPSNGLKGTRQARVMYGGLYTAMTFLTIRNLFRFVEFAQATALTWPAPDGTYVLSEQQVLFYCLDTLPILLVFVCFALAHPGRLLPPDAPPSASAAPEPEPRDVEAAAAAAGKEALSSDSPKSSRGAFKVSVVDA